MAMQIRALVDSLLQDLRFGARLLRQNPGFTTVSVLSLALGIGANSAIFQLLDAVRLRPLPVQKPHELAEIRFTESKGGRTGRFTGRRPQLTEPLWRQIRQHQQGFSDTFAWGSGRFNLAQGGEARYADGLWVSGEFFQALGVAPVLGRVFSAADDTPGCGSAGAVLGYAFWQREFGGDRSVVGRTLRLDGQPFQVIGVSEARFFGVEVGRSFDVAIPICAEPLLLGENSGIGKPDVWWLAVMGRLKRGWTAAKATEQLRAISKDVVATTLPQTYAADDTQNYLAFKLGAEPAASGVSSSLRRQYETPLWLLLAIAGLVLAIACANLANLMLARASARGREIAVRLSLGASRVRLVRQLLAESLLLAALGALAGAWLARLSSRALVAFLSTDGDRLFVDLGTDWRVLGFTAALAVSTCLLFGLAPALRATRATAGALLKTAGRGLTDARERLSLRRGLVVVQVALSLVLVVGALLFGRSLGNLMTVDAGFRQSGLLVTRLDLRRAGIAAAQRLELFRQVRERIRAVPGVESAAQAFIVPVSGAGWNDNVVSDGSGGRKPKLLVNFNRVGNGFFATMGTPLLLGRDFDQRDTLAAPLVAIVNETFARDVLRRSNPVGHTFELERRPGEQQRRFEIVGVVKDTKYSNLRETFTPIAYLPMTQETQASPFAAFLLRSRAPLGGLTASISRAVTELDPEIAIQFRAFETQIRESMLRERLMATLSGAFGVLAAVLATVGLYGVMAYAVSRRTNEIGVRMALGAARRDIVAMVLREAGAMVMGGVVIGALLSLAAAQAAKSLLFGLTPNDPAALAGAALGLSAVAAAASYWPAARAARVEPVVALREE
jgi:predicted permease